jgi:hypothetical protein
MNLERAAPSVTTANPLFIVSVWGRTCVTDLIHGIKGGSKSVRDILQMPQEPNETMSQHLEFVKRLVRWQGIAMCSACTEVRVKSVRVFFCSRIWTHFSLDTQGRTPYATTHPKRVLITSPILFSNAFGKVPEKYRLKALGFRGNGRYGV